MKLFYKEKSGNRRILHILGLKIKYNKPPGMKTQNNKTYEDRLNADEWASLYNIEQKDSLINSIKNKNYYVQTDELLKIAPAGSKTLEIGSGTGQTSLCLAQKGCNVTLLDYSSECLELSKAAAKELNLDINTVCADATKELPFEENYFDIIFHAGLLEHFTKEERINMLTLWRKYCKRMISLVPNASCLAYRVGKNIMEQTGNWPYGVENPLYTQIDEFEAAGYKVEKEYTIGIKHALNFLDNKSPLHKVLADSINNKEILDDFHQGYLLVTVGKAIDKDAYANG